MDRIIETLYSDEVTVTADIFMGLGDTTAYTVGVFTLIAHDHLLVQVLIFSCVIISPM